MHACALSLCALYANNIVLRIAFIIVSYRICPPFHHLGPRRWCTCVTGRVVPLLAHIFPMIITWVAGCRACCPAQQQVLHIVYYLHTCACIGTIPYSVVLLSYCSTKPTNQKDDITWHNNAHNVSSVVLLAELLNLQCITVQVELWQSASGQTGKIYCWYIITTKYSIQVVLVHSL